MTDDQMTDEIRAGLADAESEYESAEVSSGLTGPWPDTGPQKANLIDIDVRRSVFRYGTDSQVPATVIQSIYESVFPDGAIREWRGEPTFIPDHLSSLKASLPEKGRGCKGIVESMISRRKGMLTICCEGAELTSTGGLMADIDAVRAHCTTNGAIECDINVSKNAAGYHTDWVNGARKPDAGG